MHKVCLLVMCAVLALWVPSSSADDGCGYTFNVPGDGCQQTAMEADIVNLQASNTYLVGLVNDMEAQVDTLQTDNSALRQDVDNMTPSLCNCGDTAPGCGNTVYTMWGMDECPSGATKIYDGFMAGPNYQTAGGPSDNACLPSSPQWPDNVVPNVQGSAAYWGVETERASSYQGFDFSNSPGISDIRGQDPLCASCRRSGKTVTTTFPAMRTCPTGWTLEYEGMMMASYPLHAGRTRQICMNKSPKFDPNGGARLLQSLVYITEVECGSLPCDPYTDGGELACVVCSI